MASAAVNNKGSLTTELSSSTSRAAIPIVLFRLIVQLETSAWRGLGQLEALAAS
jgi:hypothetical protein